MSILKGLLKVGLSPLNGVAEIFRDLSGRSDEESDDTGAIQALSGLTLGASSVIKGTAKGIVDGVDEIFN